MYGGQTRPGEFLDSLSRGFQQTSLELFLFFFLLFATVTILVVVFLVQKRRGRRENREPSAERQGPRIDSGTARTPGLSAKLPEGSPVLLIAPEGTRFRGKVIGQGRLDTAVKLSAGDIHPAKGSRVSLYFQNSAGVFSFPTRIIDLAKDVVRVEQSSSLTFHQPRRKYLRRKEYLPVFVRPSASFENPFASTLLDLSGGGASLRNSGGMLERGNILELSFSPETETPVLVARVLRLSKLGKVAHVKFEPLSDAERKRIMTFIFTQSRRYKNPQTRRSTEESAFA